MQVDQFRRDDVQPFLSLAGEEGWLCSEQEFAFLLDSFPQGCFCMRQGGEPVAFVTSIKYGTSAWIGNLIVKSGLRGKGIGGTLMTAALDALEKAGAATVWLTASAQGAPIYERLGFEPVDTIRRWQGTIPFCDENNHPASHLEFLMIDRTGWGDRRDLLLSTLLEKSVTRSTAGGFIFLQPMANGIQLGPWGSISTLAATALIDRILASTSPAVPAFLDVPALNEHAALLLYQRGFTVRSSTLLMIRGEKPRYKPQHIYALASMGSMG